jgi:hypothetical protein
MLQGNSAGKAGQQHQNHEEEDEQELNEEESKYIKCIIRHSKQKFPF